MFGPAVEALLIDDPHPASTASASVRHAAIYHRAHRRLLMTVPPIGTRRRARQPILWLYYVASLLDITHPDSVLNGAQPHQRRAVMLSNEETDGARR